MRSFFFKPFPALGYDVHKCLYNTKKKILETWFKIQNYYCLVITVIVIDSDSHAAGMMANWWHIKIDNSVENIPYRYSFRIIITLIHKTRSYGKHLSWILYRLHEMLLSYERTTLIWIQIEFKLLLKRVQRTLRGPTMMIPTKIKRIKSKIYSAVIL